MEMKIEKDWTKLFPLFNEMVVRRWFEVEYGWEIIRNHARVLPKNNQPIKFEPPPHDWIKIPLKWFNEFVEKKETRSFFDTDGLFRTQNGEIVAIEVKNWIPPFTQDGRLVNNPWALRIAFAQKCTSGGNEYSLDRIILVYWSPENDERDGGNGLEKHQIIINEINKLIQPRKFEIVYFKDILTDCIENQPEWYSEIISEFEGTVRRFLDFLKGSQHQKQHEN